jgi:hypothetical protein
MECLLAFPFAQYLTKILDSVVWFVYIGLLSKKMFLFRLRNFEIK